MRLKEINNSSRKTKELIKKTFAELIKEKKVINNITVKELATRANISRASFYSHYENIYEVAAEIQDEVLATIFHENIVVETKNDVNNYIDKIFAYLKENQEFYSKLLVADDPMIFMQRLNKLLIKALEKALPNKVNHLDILLFSNGVINIILEYFREEIPEDLDQICEYVKKTFDFLFIDN